jgi:hypothetical protein
VAAQVVSVVDAAHEALGLTRRQLFPLRPSRWLTLGFVAFLDQCGRGTGFGGGGVPGAPAAEGGVDPRPLLRWAVANPVPAALVGAAALAAAVALIALILWVNSRGSFVYADLVATGRAEVARPWGAHRAAARSYFVLRFALVGLTIVGLAAMAVALGVVALALATLSRARPGYLLIGFGLLFLMLLFAIVMSLLSVLLRDFVVPLQLQTGLPSVAAARLLRSLIVAEPGAFALYVLLKVAFTLGVAAAMIVVCCFTCALGLLPVLGQTILQPAYYFERAWSLFLLRQMGHDTFAALAPAV